MMISPAHPASPIAAAMAEADGALRTGPAARAAMLQDLRPKLTRLDNRQLAELERLVDGMLAEGREPR